MIYTLYIKSDEDVIIDTITFDSVTSFNETYSSNVPQSVVESGYNVSDTVNLSNPTFTLNGVITDSKFRVDGHLVVFAGNSFEKVESTSLKTINQDEAAKAIREKLIAIWEQSVPIGLMESEDVNNPVGSEVRDIFPCFITNLSFPKNDSSEAFFPTITFERVRYTSVKIANVDNAAPELIPLAKQEKVGTADTSSGSAAVKTNDLKVLDNIAERIDGSIPKVGESSVNNTSNPANTAKIKEMRAQSDINMANSRVLDAQRRVERDGGNMTDAQRAKEVGNILGH